MRKLKNWDNKTWLSSDSYISQFNRFLKEKFTLIKIQKYWTLDVEEQIL